MNKYIAGVDEVGRGCLAGPVVACAVVLPPDYVNAEIKDSKKLSAKKREDARRLICAEAAAWGIGYATAEEIDAMNILAASLLAMKRAFERMAADFEAAGGVIEAVADGLFVPDIPVPCSAMVKADARVPEVMAASILAKTARDSEMERYAKLYPEYGYEKHKGYPTKAHREAILKYGPSPIQRVTFTVKPV